MVSMLWKKILRDIFENRWSFLATVCICTLGIGLFSGINLYLSSITSEIDESYARANLSDYWIYKAAVTEEDLAVMLSRSEIGMVERRKTTEASLSGGRNGALRLHGISEACAVNIPELVEGEPLTDGEADVLLLDDRFAEANNIHVGDILTISVSGGEAEEWTVGGIVRSAEYIYYTPDGLTVPDPTTHGYAYVSADSLQGMPYNELAITLVDELSHEAAMTMIRDTLGSVNIIGRANQFSVSTIKGDINGITSVGILLPIVFFFTAALVTWIVVGRMMENQRQHLGTLRSIGFRRAEITVRYSVFGLMITLPSMLFGWMVSRGMGGMLYEMGVSQYSLGKRGVQAISWQFWAASFCVFAVTCGAAWLSCHRALRATPATLMRPKPPAQGHRILLEQLRPFWLRLSFSGKIVTRNLFRNKTRLLMGLIGVIGSAALLVCGFGIRDSMDRMVTLAFDETVRSDMEIKLKQSIPVEEMARLLPGAENLDAAMAFTVYLYGEGANVQNPYLVVLDDDQTSLAFADENGAPVALPARGVLITPRLSRALSALPGDMVDAERLDGTAFPLEVASIVDFPVGNEIYISRSAFAEISTEEFTPRTYLVRGSNIDLSVIRDDSRISLIETTAQMEENMQVILRFTRMIQAMIILFAGGLAFAVMMVLGRLNFHERIRELATLKVLGFHRDEMKRLVLRENLWITLLALPVGLFVGRGLLQVMILMSVTPESEPTAYIGILSIVLVCILTIAFTLFVNFLMSRKFKGIDMVASLKSVE